MLLVWKIYLYAKVRNSLKMRLYSVKSICNIKKLYTKDVFNIKLIFTEAINQLYGLTSCINTYNYPKVSSLLHIKLEDIHKNELAENALIPYDVQIQ